MNRQEVADIQEVIFEKLRMVRVEGQKEYAHDEGNAFRNFESLAAELHMTREKVLWIYLRKHMDGILAHLNGHTSQREPVDGRLKDAIMYLMLLWGMIIENGRLQQLEPVESSPSHRGAISGKPLYTDTLP